jgi:hypothetical protein
VSRDEPIDIMQEVIDLYGREEMLAFFDFGIERAGQAPLSGICRISKPKDQGQLRYLSLVFVVDTPDVASQRFVPKLLGKLDSDALRAHVAELAEAVVMPASASRPENYVQQIDLLLDADVEPDQSFISAKLLPAIRNLTGLHTSELVWWNETSPSAAKPAAQRAPDTLLDGLRRLLRGQ